MEVKGKKMKVYRLTGLRRKDEGRKRRGKERRVRKREGREED